MSSTELREPFRNILGYHALLMVILPTGIKPTCRVSFILRVLVNQ